MQLTLWLWIQRAGGWAGGIVPHLAWLWSLPAWFTHQGLS
ncbi:MAG: hypothetical protein RLZZ516_621 [Cyanobacteriota bacterium]|jgi:hypothetical protein